MLVASIILVFLFGPPQDHRRIYLQGVASILSLGNIGAYINNGDYFNSNFNPFVHTWSLAVEAQIYITIPILFLILNLVFKNILKTFISVYCFLLTISLAAFSLPRLMEPIYLSLGINNPEVFIYYFTLERLWQFTLGGLGFLLFKTKEISTRRFKQILGLFFFATISYCALDLADFSLTFDTIVISLSTLFVLIYKLVEILPNKISTILVWAGNRSYSIYLYHLPFLYLEEFSGVTNIVGLKNKYLSTIVVVIFILVIASLSYSFVESRFRIKPTPNSIEDKRLLLPSLSLLLIPAGLCVCLIFSYQHSYFGLLKKVKVIPYAANFYDENCLNKLQNANSCIFGTAGQKTVLLIGDSHAGDLSIAIRDVAHLYGYNLVVFGVYTGCKFQIFDTSKVEVRKICTKLGRNILDYVVKNKPDFVILSQYNKSEFLQADLQNAILTLKKLNPNLLVVQTKPVFPDKADFQRERPIVLGDYSAPRYFEESKMETSNLQIQKDMAEFLKKNNIAFIDFRSIFCSDKICTRFSNGRWLYYDVDHFSIYGAELTKPFFLNFFSSGIDKW